MKRCYSLKKNKEFQAVYRIGKSVGSSILVLVYAKARHVSVKAGFSVSKKVGNSVVRNKIKRRLKESFRMLLPSVKKGYNFIFIARNTIVPEKYQSIQKTMEYLLTRANLMEKEAKKDEKGTALVNKDV